MRAPSKLSSCTSPLPWDFPAAPFGPCPGNSATNNQYTSFSGDFNYYNASTGKNTNVPWSWAPGPNDLDMAFGVCYQYYDCSASGNVFYREGFANGAGAAYGLKPPTTVSQGQNPASFWWVFDNYQSPTFSSCGACAPDPGGLTNLTSVNAARPSVTFYFSWDCSVTPP